MDSSESKSRNLCSLLSNKQNECRGDAEKFSVLMMKQETRGISANYATTPGKIGKNMIQYSFSFGKEMEYICESKVEFFTFVR